MNKPLKWVGGKVWLAPRLAEMLPPNFMAGDATLHERFAGGASLFFYLRSLGWTGPAVLSDANPRLMRAYDGIKNEPEKVCDLTNAWGHEHDVDPEAAWAKISRQPVDRFQHNYQVAAWLLYVSKAGFNGLYRVNKQGQYNVAIGKNAKGVFNRVKVSPDEVIGWSTALVNTTLRCVDLSIFGQSPRMFDEPNRPTAAKEGDVVYLDPPYIDTFDDYTGHGFSVNDHRGLELSARKMADRGVHVIASNSDTPTTRKVWGLVDGERSELWGEHWQAVTVSRRGTMNSAPTKRQSVAELLITPRNP